MRTILNFLTTCLFAILIFSCNKKTIPGHSHTTTTVNKSSSSESTATTTEVNVKKTKAPVPTVIVVNDNVAHKTVDGRYYYDLNGKRYWRNNKDGKYYLFNKSMYNNPDFKPTGQ